MQSHLVAGWTRYAFPFAHVIRILRRPLQCNPGLSELIHQTLQVPKGVFLKDLYKLEVRSVAGDLMDY